MCMGLRRAAVGVAGREVGQQPMSSSGRSLLLGHVGLGAAWHLGDTGVSWTSWEEDGVFEGWELTAENGAPWASSEERK